jgi:hypothetical protein
MTMVRSLIASGIWASDRFAVSGIELVLTGEQFGAEMRLVLEVP